MDEEGVGFLYFLHDDASDEVGVVVIREALQAQRERLAELWVDVCSDAPWPFEVLWAVDALEARRVTPPRKWYRRNPTPGVSVQLDPQLDEDFAIMRAVAPYTFSGTGIDRQGEMIYDVDDTGTSVALWLTTSEYDFLCQRLKAAAITPDWLYRAE